MLRREHIQDIFHRLGPHLDLTGSVRPIKQLAARPGSHANIFFAHWKGSDVCAKVLRPTSRGGDFREKLDERAKRELVVWSSMDHPNVLPLYGYSFGLGPSLTFISPYIPGGSARAFLRSHPFVDRFKLVIGIGEGLAYMHGRGVTHGDLKGTNVLVSGSPADPTPLLCDFGLSKTAGVRGFTTTVHGTTCWMAMELLGKKDSDDCVLTPASDVWAWGMTLYELFTETIPFRALSDNGFLLAKYISNGGYPDYPGSPATERGLSSAMWRLLLKCWSPLPTSRPSAADVVDETRQLHALWLLTEDARMQYAAANF